MRPFLGNVSGKSKVDITDFAGGLNTTTDKSFLLDNQLCYMKNMSYIKYPELTTRQNRTSLAFYMNDITDYATATILAMHTTSKTRIYTVERQFDMDYLCYYDIEKEDSKRNVVGPLSFSSLRERYSITECKDANSTYIIISNNSGRWSIIENNDPTREFKKYEDEHYGIVENHKSRLWIAKGHTLTFSELQKYDGFEMNSEDVTDVSMEAGQILVTNARGNITAIKSFDDKLVIFCEYSMHIIYGDSPNSSVNQFTLIDLENDIGCANSNAIDICNRKLYWLDMNASVYEYDGSYLNRINEPNSNDSYGVKGGIKDAPYYLMNPEEWCLTGGKDKIYITLLQEEESKSNKYLFVFDVQNRVWWCEDGEICIMTCWRTRGYALVIAKYDSDIQLTNQYYTENVGITDLEFNRYTRSLQPKEIEYEFETKFFLLGGIANKKTLTEVWFQANANAKVYVSDSWTSSNPWYVDVKDDRYLLSGNIATVTDKHSIKEPTIDNHEGKERQRIIIPKMYLQKVNGFSIRVKGTGRGHFYILEKKWRIR